MSQFQPPSMQTPLYPQPPQPPKKQSHATRWFIVAISAAVLLIVLIAVATQGKSNSPTTTAQATQVPTQESQATSQPTTGVTQAPTVRPTPTPKPNPHGDIGVTQQSDVWSITVNSVKTLAYDEYDTPKSGNVYILINFTANNTGSSNQDMSPIYFTLRDDQGNSYDIAYITVPSDPRGAVVAGQKLRGDLSYEIPKSLHSFTLQFDSPTDTYNTQIVQWQLID